MSVYISSDMGWSHLTARTIICAKTISDFCSRPVRLEVTAESCSSRTVLMRSAGELSDQNVAKLRTQQRFL